MIFFRAWKLGIKSPGSENDCGGQKNVPEDNKYALVKSISSIPVIESQPSTSAQASTSAQFDDSAVDLDYDVAGTSPNVWTSVIPKKLNEDIKDDYKRTDQCTAEDKKSQRFGEEMTELERLKLKKQKIVEDPIYNDFPWSISHYQVIWEKQFMKWQGDWFPQNVFKSAKSWINYIFNEKNPRASTFNCRICSFMAPLSNLRKADVSILAKPEGVQLKDKERNRQLIANHEKSYGHQRHLEDMAMMILDKSTEELLDLLNKIKDLKENPLNKVTSNVMTIVFHEVKMNLSLQKHKEQMELMEQFKVNVGLDHCKSDYTIKEMVLVMSDGILKEIIKSMNKLKMPLAITLDSSTDVSNM